jgi:hypothetical protein
MTEREQNIKNMFIASTQFDEINFNDYKTLPDAAANFTNMRASIATLETQSAAQISGKSSRAVEQVSVLRAAIRRKLKRYSRTARALNLDDAGFRRLFRVPDNDSDQVLLAYARETVTESRRFATEFAGRGIPATLADDLEADINAMEASITAKASGKIGSIGATAAIDEAIRSGMKSAKILDSIMHNVYFDNPTKLVQWITARHVKSTSKKAVKPKPPTT